ncbi:Inner membrane protein YbaN [Vibrio stylophorae]|uniref:Inner membrane protein n=1 Tax=Vibrio stylophorae TaxID=659351 RepID=A0ABN8DUA1_9VIBR|nr:YbaN family protein [Vibrio stylophorae]CAH0532932.1 Inner membrane protein YbaN [Vibrio stylophorae]
MPLPAVQGWISRIILLTIAWLSLLLGAIGIFLPLLPTTPFVILASACFMRASPKLNRWLLAHPKFGPLLNAWHTHRAIPAKVKPRAIALIVLSFSWSIYMLDGLLLRILVFTMGCILLCWFCRLPTLENIAAKSENP